MLVVEDVARNDVGALGLRLLQFSLEVLLAFQGARTLPLDAGDEDLSLRAPTDDVAAAQGRSLADIERR